MPEPSQNPSSLQDSANAYLPANPAENSGTTHSSAPGSPALSENPKELPQVVVDTSENPNVKEPSLPILGFYLSRFVLWIITGFLIVFLVYIFTRQFDASNSFPISETTNISDSNFSKKLEVMRIIQEEKKNSRDFTIQIAQMVLLNLLLPVLTAILGYIFASNKNREG